MTRLLALLLLALTAAVDASEKPRLVGYLPYGRAAALEVGRFPGLTDLMLFSGEPRADGSLDATRLDKTPWEKVTAVRASGTRVHLCLGGWGRSRHFAAVTADHDRMDEVTSTCPLPTPPPPSRKTGQIARIRADVGSLIEGIIAGALPQDVGEHDARRAESHRHRGSERRR